MKNGEKCGKISVEKVKEEFEMNVYDAIMTRRTIRKFEQREVARENLVKLIDCARVAAYGANVQPLKFAVIDDKETLKNIYPFTKWAGALADGAPKESERPGAGG